MDGPEDSFTEAYALSVVQGGGQRVSRPKEAQSLDREYKGCVNLTAGSVTSVADAAGKQEDVKTSWASFLL